MTAPRHPWDDSDIADVPVVRCRCGHGPSAHTGGYGQCWTRPCACGEYRDALEDAMRRHPSGKALPQTADITDYLRQKGEL